MDVKALYQEQILALARIAREAEPLASSHAEAVARNPICGDEVTVSLALSEGGDVITGLFASVKGCVLCEAAAGLLLETCLDSSTTQMLGLADEIEAWLKSQSETLSLEGQEAFTPVKEIPMRHACVSLPFSAASDAIKGVNP